MIVEAIRRSTSLPLDVHLMIEGPSRYFKQFAEAGASALTVHVENCPHIHRDVEAIHELGLRAGVAISPGTPPIALESILSYVDLVLVMTVNPGFGGQSFIEGMLRKIVVVRAMIASGGMPIDLAVDGRIIGEDGGSSPASRRRHVRGWFGGVRPSRRASGGRAGDQAGHRIG